MTEKILMDIKFQKPAPEYAMKGIVLVSWRNIWMQRHFQYSRREELPEFTANFLLFVRYVGKDKLCYGVRLTPVFKMMGIPLEWFAGIGDMDEVCPTFDEWYRDYVNYNARERVQALKSLYDRYKDDINVRSYKF